MISTTQPWNSYYAGLQLNYKRYRLTRRHLRGLAWCQDKETNQKEGTIRKKLGLSMEVDCAFYNEVKNRRSIRKIRFRYLSNFSSSKQNNRVCSRSFSENSTQTIKYFPWIVWLLHSTSLPDTPIAPITPFLQTN
ncbi:hypothetical protein CEXT_757571 [Caerostris extrusa]|uniref:Uncharacterized protein n=1 Tax=Caerostris extrusa TaxID=172846 RepID=A0AAV4YC73_CAEEX|nr:hypothetical protein CEXT_757571 [Caerostris extrusa]